MKRTPLPSQDYLRECFAYDPDTGVLTWRERPLSHFENPRIQLGWNTRHSNTPAGALKAHGYRAVKLDRCMYLAHRLIWVLVVGEEPHVIDHRNRNRADNRISNLRNVSPSENCHNQKPRNPEGLPGVARASSPQRWRARISLGGRQIYLGRFDTPEEAHEAYKAAAQKYYPGINKDLA